ARNILMGQGYQVCSASDGEQALAILARQPVDLLLSDIIMPKMNGYQLVEKVKQQYPKVQLRLVSGYEGDVETRGAAIKLDAPVIKKPYKASVLLGSIRSQLDQAIARSATPDNDQQHH
ncbi:MAG: response regulator, partial [Algicola sp.]|nr:response regulator [Algicola sp.]